MSEACNIAKNFIALSIAQVISIGLFLVLVIFITRYIGNIGYGKLGFATFLTVILTTLTPKYG